MRKEVFIGLGSNLGDRMENLRKAIRELSNSSMEIQMVSSVYESLPMNSPPGSRPFFNAVINGLTGLSPLVLLKFLQGIERRLGRVWHDPNAPRRIDLDILLYGNENFQTDALVVPHPKMLERSFVLIPLKEIAPDFLHPVVSKTFCQLAQNIGKEGLLQIQKLDEGIFSVNP